MNGKPDGVVPTTGLLRRRRRSLLDLLTLSADPGEMSLAIRAAGLASRELVNRRNQMDKDMQLTVDMIVESVPVERIRELQQAITDAIISTVEGFGLHCGGSVDLIPAKQEETDGPEIDP